MATTKSIRLSASELETIKTVNTKTAYNVKLPFGSVSMVITKMRTKRFRLIFLDNKGSMYKSSVYVNSLGSAVKVILNTIRNQSKGVY